MSRAGPPFPGDPNNLLGSASATTSTNFSGSSANGTSFTATANATASNPPPPGLFGALSAAAGQGGTYYTFTLDHPSYVSLDASFSPSFSGSFLFPRSGSFAGDVSLRAGSEGGGIVQGDGNNPAPFALSAISSSGSNAYTTVHAGPLLITAGTYALIGRVIATADTGQTSSADMTVNLSITSISDRDSVGQLNCLAGTVTVTRPGGAHQPAVFNMPIHMGDVIESSAGAKACLLFIDGTTIRINDMGKVTVDLFLFDPNSTHGGTAQYNVLTGVFSYLSGLVAKKPDPDVQIVTPLGHIGIRGTELIGNIGGTSATVYLNEGEIAITPLNTGTPNIYDAQTVITFNGNGATTSPFSQDAYDALKNQIAGAVSDTQPPTMSCASPPSGWLPTNVIIACNASDSGSGLANAADVSFTLSTSVAAGLENGNASTNSRQVCDKGGNCATAGPITGIMVDEKPPTIIINAPVNGNYLLNATNVASYQCQDGGSGLQSCLGPVGDGMNLDTSSVGNHTFTVSAKDNVGNAASVSSTFAVSYAVCSLYDSTRAVRSGSTLPLKIALCDAAGNDASRLEVAVHATSLTQVSTSASNNVADAGNSNPDHDFRFDPTLGSAGGYIFNLQTTGLSTGTYMLSFTAGTDPATHSVYFQVR